ncbi:hypothetical protein [Dyadobacter psychrotolerans]|uniref:Outer membrane protein beta-barrel domain-containing protein n=1 Tax=Dyadobacter psychrotolerans TaxID=2541721 RepID=A0A4R5DWM9_9BACT|nr:hypothetical protein [Dyadobacter psychrotolerans]TDE18297.1 hypothetical protein E0F88_01785 [Dyadobacter psychrotolerans]
MNTHSLLRLSFFVFSILLSLGSLAQESASSICNNPNGGCDTLAVEKKISPWRVGGFLGPAVAFCGSWEGTFNSNKYRDKSLFNGIGFNAALNADYFFKPQKTNRFKLGVGAVAGLQNFFFRKDINSFIDKLVSDAGSSNAVIQKGSSEDHYFVVGPVLDFHFTKKPRSPFLEASLRGGIFRSTPAAIFVYDRVTGNNIYSVTASDKRYHAGMLATLGFFYPSKNGLWAWGVEAIGFRTKMNYIFPGETIYPFERKHGGFSAGIAMRRNFIRDVPVRKDPTPPLICVSPELDLKMGSESIKGFIFNTAKDTTKAEPILLTWKTRSAADTNTTETFTARIHQLNGAEDKVIASVICQEGNQLAFPASHLDVNGRPITGQYYATVTSQRLSDCASCTSEASTTGFSVIVPTVKPDTVIGCYKQCNLEIYAYKKIKSTRVVYGKTSTSCVGCICPVDTVPNTYSKYYLLGTVEIKDCDPSKLNLDEEIAKNNIKIPTWAGTVYTSVQTSVAGKCDVPQGVTKVNYKATVTKRKVGPFIKVIEKKI